MDDTKPKTWRAILTPHRSLSPKGFVILMSVIAGFNFIVGLFFYVIGAWPVVGFMGLDVALDLVGLPRQFCRCPARRAY